MLSQSELDGLIGRELPGDTFHVESYEEWLLRDVVLAPAAANGESLHPLWAFISSVRAMGVTLETMFGMCGSSAADGPLFAGCEIEFLAPIDVDVEYRTTAVIESAERKQGRRSGVFDIVTIALELLSPDGDAVATVKDSYVFPRRQ